MANQAAWLDERGVAFDVRDAPYPKVKAGHVVVRNHALAINPIDWKMQDFGILVQSWPVILGTDVAGEIVEVGDGISGMQKHDRVFGLACALTSGDNEDAAFQMYTSLPATVLGVLPDGISFEAAVALPVTLACAAAGLYEKYGLGLPLPDQERPSESTGKIILIWGGSSAVGSSAIQLARASGLNVVSTASLKNFAYVKRLGASEILDYKDSDIVDKLAKVLTEGTCVGAFDAVGKDISTCAEVLDRIGGGMVVATAHPPVDLPAGVTAHHVFATSIKDNHIGKAIFQDFIPKAMAEGKFLPCPPPTVTGHGLESIQNGVTRVKEGVSATKIVVTL